MPNKKKIVSIDKEEKSKLSPILSNSWIEKFEIPFLERCRETPGLLCVPGQGK